MTIAEGGPGRSALISRVRHMILRPTDEWQVIEGEQTTVRGLYLGYVLPMAAIWPVCSIIGGLVFGLSWGGLTFRPEPLSAILGAGLRYLLELVIVYAMAVAIDILAPSFGGTPNRIQALKTAAYAATAFWLAGVFNLVPIVAFLSVVGIYSIYLFYRGLPPLMKVAPNRVGTFTAVVVALAIIMELLAGLTSDLVTRIGLVPPPGAASTPLGGRLKLGDTEIDLGKAERAAEALQRDAERAKEGAAPKSPAVTADELHTLLPADLPNGFTRSEIDSNSSSAKGVNLAHVRALYAKGPARLTLEVTDLGSVGAFAAAFNVKTSRETADGYVHIGPVGGRMTTEEYDRVRHSGTYLVIVAERFAVSAKGDNITIEDLKTAVGVVDFPRLEAMAKG